MGHVISFPGRVGGAIGTLVDYISEFRSQLRDWIPLQAGVPGNILDIFGYLDTGVQDELDTVFTNWLLSPLEEWHFLPLHYLRIPHDKTDGDFLVNTDWQPPIYFALREVGGPFSGLILRQEPRKRKRITYVYPDGSTARRRITIRG